MATSRGLTASLTSLSISPCLRKPPPFQTSHFSTSQIVLGGPITRLRRDRAAQRLKRAKARAQDLRSQRESRADPILGHSTAFTDSLLRPREILAQPGVAAHTRTEDENWPLLTNFGINSQDALTLAQGAKAALLRRLESRVGELADPKTWTSTEKVHYENQRESMTIGKEVLDMEDARKRDVMARLIDLTNANSGAVIAANLEKAMAHFARHEGDTGSPEVQAGVLTVKILALQTHMERNRQDKRSKRALNMMIHQRQKMLKYLRRKSPERYAQCLKEIGLDDSAVVREVR